MLNTNSSLHEIYVQTYGKVKSGTKITDKDFSFSNVPNGSVPFNDKQRLAVTIAIDDQKNGEELRSRSELEQEIKRLMQ